MRTITKQLYTFSELSHAAKDRALTYFREHAVCKEWYDLVYDDANAIGLTIQGFDLDHQTISGTLTDMPSAIALILRYHPSDSLTYKIVLDYLPALAESQPDEDGYTDDYKYNYDLLYTDFRLDLLESYLILLRHEYEYQTSDEYIQSMIETNEYEFDGNGNIQ